jgi:hypothetical protein
MFVFGRVRVAHHEIELDRKTSIPLSGCWLFFCEFFAAVAKKFGIFVAN